MTTRLPHPRDDVAALPRLAPMLEETPTQHRLFFKVEVIAERPR